MVPSKILSQSLHGDNTATPRNAYHTCSGMHAREDSVRLERISSTVVERWKWQYVEHEASIKPVSNRVVSSNKIQGGCTLDHHASKSCRKLIASDILDLCHCHSAASNKLLVTEALPTSARTGATVSSIGPSNPIMSSSANANANAQGTPRSSDLSPISSTTTISSTWAPPKSPLPPHRLAKLANALGVSTPMPAVHHTTPFMSRSYLDTPAPSEAFRRSPTPSTPASNFTAYSPAISKYLLHVIPPPHLPHDADHDIDMTPPPANASGYHTQFRRGTLVPVHSNLQSQLGAIAKEYALPSTTGLILYLVSSAKTPPHNSPAPGKWLQDEEPDGLGPRLSEDIWKHLWTRVVKAEQRDDTLSPSLAKSPLGMTLETQSTPYLLHESGAQPLRPLLSNSNASKIRHPHPNASHFPPSPTSPSTTSDLHSNTKSAPPSSSSVYDPETPDTSSAAPSFIEEVATRANSLDLPGLMSPSIIPILAKVEFDIDRRKATWYEPWLRSRRMNHSKRAESRNGRKGSVADSGDNFEGSQERSRPIDFLTGKKYEGKPVSLPAEEKSNPATAVPDPAGYEQLPGQEEDEWSDDSAEEDDVEATARATLTGNKDPLADVFGTDEDTWTDLKTSTKRASKRQTDPNVVELALNAADLTALPSPTESEFEYLGKEEDEVQALLDRMSSSAGTKKHVPPPLVLVPDVLQNDRDLVIPTESPMPSSGSSAKLAYVNGADSEESKEAGAEDDDVLETEYTRTRTPADLEKREGAVFDDLDLGLDPTEDYDDNDPNDRRRSQFVMKAQLDEIERTMAQLSPRILQADLADEDSHHMPSLSPNSFTLSPGKLHHLPPSPRLPQHPDMPDNLPESPISKMQAAWPATPFASLQNTALPRRQDGPPSPPRLALNGVTTSAPKSYMPAPRSGSEISAETAMRKRELEEQGYPTLSPSIGVDSGITAESPIIPLSPDPFGRFSSSPPIPSGSGQSSAYWENEPPAGKPRVPVTSQGDSQTANGANGANTGARSDSSAVSSRFSADSIAGVEANTKSSGRTTLMTVNTIKRLWRKSTKTNSISNPPPTPSGSSFPPLPERPSQELHDGPPKTPTFGRFSPQPAPPRQSQDMPPPIPQAAPLLSAPPPHPQQQIPIPPSQQLSVPTGTFNGRGANSSPIMAAQMLPSKSGSTLDRLHFDQESPYPTRRNPSYSRPPSPPPVPSPSAQTMHLPPTAPPTARENIPPSLAPGGVAQDKEKPSIRKSILKGWKSSSTSAAGPPQQQSAEPVPRASLERPNAGAPRGRRPSVLNFGSTRSTAVSPPPDTLPSPQIPQQYIAQTDHGQFVRSKLTNGSIDSTHSRPNANNPLGVGQTSPRRSMASSRSSRDSRPSFDTSQFEIVSPKINSTLTYPYHGLDQSP
ncbi:hypothetical protein LshimejAT787_0300320 [Lyophyllum shimeji]|uniref:Uncharacterized protein n=1 Tax=Lyophyllum shimeji TaxID=47721 RepID=A0A9P3PHW7_LYOSH|nr:hypothetical protein LshimejAT787_0300320 [Lyophyllum shimeji]